MKEPERNPSSGDNEYLLQSERNPGFVAGFWHFFLESKKWWLLPPLFFLLLLGVLLALSQTAAAPLIYTLF
jgi:hypothetical protein